MTRYYCFELVLSLKYVIVIIPSVLFHFLWMVGFYSRYSFFRYISPRHRPYGRPLFPAATVHCLFAAVCQWSSRQPLLLENRPLLPPQPHWPLLRLLWPLWSSQRPSQPAKNVSSSTTVVSGAVTGSPGFGSKISATPATSVPPQSPAPAPQQAPKPVQLTQDDRKKIFVCVACGRGPYHEGSLHADAPFVHFDKTDDYPEVIAINTLLNYKTINSYDFRAKIRGNNVKFWSF